MARVEIFDLMSNRQDFPDDMEIDLGNGRTTTVKDFRDQVMHKNDFNKASEGWKTERGRLEQGLDAAQQNLARAVAERDEATRNRQPEPSDPTPPQRTGYRPSMKELEEDPVLGLLVDEVKAARKELADFKQSTQQTLTNHENTWTRQEMERTLGRLRANDADLDPVAFNAYAQKYPVIDTARGLVDLEKTYTNFANDRLLEKARKDGEERGYEKGKKAASVPHIPMGRRSVPKRPEGVPERTQDVKVEDVLNDPDIQAAFSQTE
jgi:hypothetical protein